MDFKDATSLLIEGASIDALAKAIGCSPASVRQARLPEGAKAWRAPPKQWEEGLASLAEEHASRLLDMAKVLDKQRLKRAK
jgi:hypothetical protein